MFSFSLFFPSFLPSPLLFIFLASRRLMRCASSSPPLVDESMEKRLGGLSRALPLALASIHSMGEHRTAASTAAPHVLLIGQYKRARSLPATSQ